MAEGTPSAPEREISGYTALSEERILRHCPDVRDCTVLAAAG
ncbi:hypothetical protein ABIH81_21025 [Micromonospora sp. HUAS YX12]|uniref:Uncharacterized protein n=1 Tax=Micromonospora sp. HUAS YX12 TaxID=3156396 RepID=A0AAU7QVQ5_9ACTN